MFFHFCIQWKHSFKAAESVCFRSLVCQYFSFTRSFTWLNFPPESNSYHKTSLSLSLWLLVFVGNTTFSIAFCNLYKRPKGPHIVHLSTMCHLFIRPSSDGTYYGMVMSVRPSGSPSVRHSFPHFSPTCFDILIWNFVYHLIFMHVRSSSNAINFRHFLQELCSFLTSNSYKYAVFRTFLLLFCFDILSSNFVYDFFLMYHRASLSFVILLQFLLELWLFVNLEYSKYTVFRTFLLHALTYWAKILHMTLFYCTTDQVRVSSICVNFCGSYAPFGT